MKRLIKPFLAVLAVLLLASGPPGFAPVAQAATSTPPGIIPAGGGPRPVVLPQNPPSGLTAKVVGGTVELSWQDNAAGAVGFIIERRGDRGVYADIAAVGKGVARYADTTVKPGLTYFYRVRMTAGTVRAAFSNEAMATLPHTGTVQVTAGQLVFVGKSFEIATDGLVFIGKSSEIATDGLVFIGKSSEIATDGLVFFGKVLDEITTGELVFTGNY